MSYSFREPDWPVFCECKYDEARDEMDRDDCPFHCDLRDNAAREEGQIATRKRPTRADDVKELKPRPDAIYRYTDHEVG